MTTTANEICTAILGGAAAGELTDEDLTRIYRAYHEASRMRRDRETAQQRVLIGVGMRVKVTGRLRGGTCFGAEGEVVNVKQVRAGVRFDPATLSVMDVFRWGKGQVVAIPLTVLSVVEGPAATKPVAKAKRPTANGGPRTKDVKVGGRYKARINQRDVVVRITMVSKFGGWDAVNETTGRDVRIKSAAKLREEA